MARENALFGKTFDQQLEITGPSVNDVDIAPNRRIRTEVVFEPLGTGVRMTARDDKHRLLWAFIGSQGMLDHNQVHCPVAVYETLRGLLAEELKNNGLPAPILGEPMKSAADALDALRATLAALEKSLSVKKVTTATLERARAISIAAVDANRQICLTVPRLGAIAGEKSAAEFAP